MKDLLGTFAIAGTIIGMVVGIFFLIVITTQTIEIKQAIDKKDGYYIINTNNPDKKLVFKGYVIHKTIVNTAYYFKLDNNQGWVICSWKGFVVIDQQGNIKASEDFPDKKSSMRILAKHDKEFNKVFNKKYKSYIYLCGPPSKNIGKNNEKINQN